MNAYFITAGKQEVLAEYIDYWARYEETYLCDVVFAESSGKAKSIFWNLNKDKVRFQIEYVDLRYKLIEKDVERPLGIAKWNDEYWEKISYVVSS